MSLLTEKTLRAKDRYVHPQHQYARPDNLGSPTCHYNTGDKWCVYPMYDFAHPIEDAIEGITHSICTLEFEDHRPVSTTGSSERLESTPILR